MRADSYRPINLLQATVKIWEKATLICITRCIGISKSQLAYQARLGCEDLLAMLIDCDGLAYENGDWVVEVLLDMSRAYERVSLSAMYAKLLDTSIPLHIIEMIMSFLRERKAKVRVRLGEACFFSEWGEYACGLPQGSVLGPVLFLLYIEGAHKHMAAAAEEGDTSFLNEEEELKALKKR